MNDDQKSSCSLADKAGNGRDWIGASATKLLATVDELDLLLFDYQHNAVGVLCDGIDSKILRPSRQ